MSGYTLGRVFATVSCLVVFSLTLSGCGHCYEPPPMRKDWPTLTAPPGAQVLEQQATPMAAQTLAFITEMSRQQVEQFYLDTLKPQGWQRDATGGISDFTHCPYLWLELALSNADGGRTQYRVSFGQQNCQGAYC